MLNTSASRYLYKGKVQDVFFSLFSMLALQVDLKVAFRCGEAESGVSPLGGETNGKLGCGGTQR